jgi:hypothetical protein
MPIGQLLDERVVTTVEVMRGIREVGMEWESRRPTYESLVPILLRCGATPEQLASIPEFDGFGTWADHSMRRAAYFGQLSQNPDPALATVGKAGIATET